MRQGWIRLLLPVAGLALVAYLVANAVAANVNRSRVGQAQRLEIGRPVPAFSLATLDGGTVTPRDLEGRPVLLNFWASWCGPCQQEMPDIDAVARLGRDKVHVLAINEQEPAAVARQFMERNGYSLRVALDPDGALFSGWNFRALPTSVVLDPRGYVCGVREGTLTQDEMKAALALASKGCAAP